MRKKKEDRLTATPWGFMKRDITKIANGFYLYKNETQKYFVVSKSLANKYLSKYTMSKAAAVGACSRYWFKADDVWLVLLELLPHSRATYEFCMEVNRITYNDVLETVRFKFPDYEDGLV